MEGLEEKLAEVIGHHQSRSDKAYHDFYQVATQHASELAVHFCKANPSALLDKVRPNEPPTIKQYRLESWQPVTYASAKKVETVVHRSLDNKLHDIQFPAFPRNDINEREGLERYLEDGLPYYYNLNTFLRTVLIKRMLYDPNAVLYVEPISYEITDQELFQPTFYIIPSSGVLAYQPEAYYILTYQKNKDQYYIAIDDERVIHANSKGDTNEFLHFSNEPPAFQLGGILTGEKEPYYYESFVSGVLPHWNRVVTKTSDLDAVEITKMYPQEWEVDTEDDDFVAGLQNPGFDDDCDDCPQPSLEDRPRRISGKDANSPYKKKKVQINALNPETNIPMPPAGFIERDIATAEFMARQIEKEEYKGFRAVNMEFLSEYRGGESGVKSALDRSELNALLTQVSDHVFKRCLPKMIRFINDYRYHQLLTEVQRDEYQPVITAPTSFNVLTIDYLTEELNNSNNLSTPYKKKLEMDITKRRFNTQTSEQARLLTIIQLDPLYDMSSEDIALELQLNLIRKEDVVIHRYIERFVYELLEENLEFLSLTYQEKQVKLLEKAQGMITELTPTTLPVDVG